jgi:hypothetical protein
MVERHSPSEELRRLYDTFVLEDVGKNTCHFDKQHPRFQAAIKENTSPLVLLGASVSLQRMRSLVGVPKHFEIENAEQLQSRFFLFSKASRQEHRLAESGKPRKSSLFRRGEGIAAESLVYFLASQAGLSVAVSNMREDTLGQDLHLRINGSEVSVDITSNNSFEFASKKLRNTNSLTLFLPFRHGEKMIDKNLFKEYHELLVEMTQSIRKYLLLILNFS